MFSDAKHLRGQGGSAPNQKIYIFCLFADVRKVVPRVYEMKSSHEKT